MRSADRSFYTWFVLGIVLIGAAMRFYSLDAFSLTNDELSALVRVRYDNFRDLIRLGVMETDPHPAGVQIFLWLWAGIAGKSEFMIRLPFVLASSLVPYFVYRIGRSAFNSLVGSLAAALFALGSFTLIHGQMARPYAFGLLFTTVFAWQWLVLLKVRSSVHITAVMAFILSGWLACMTHYFAGLTIMIIAISGLGEAYKKGMINRYLTWLSIMALLYVPHIPVTIHQLSRGALVNWITPPDWEFLFEYLMSLSNHSLALMIILIGLIIFMRWRFGNGPSQFMGFRWMLLLWWTSPLIIGYLYSHLSGPVLMQRVMIFSFPFLAIHMFSLLPEINSTLQRVVGFGFVLSLVVITIGIHDVYSYPKTENIKGVAEALTAWEERFGSDQIAYSTNLNSPEYVRFYYRGEAEFEQDRIEKDEDLAVLQSAIRKSDRPMYSLSWASMYQPVTAFEYAKRHYPLVMEERFFYNSGAVIYQKGALQRDTVFVSRIKFDRQIENWNVTMDQMKSDTLGNHWFEMGEQTEWGPTFTLPLSELGNPIPLVVNVHVTLSSSKPKGFVLVTDVVSADGASAWEGLHVEPFIVDNGLSEVFVSKKLPYDVKLLDELKIYLWNSEQGTAKVCSMEITAFADSNYPLDY